MIPRLVSDLCTSIQYSFPTVNTDHPIFELFQIITQGACPHAFPMSAMFHDGFLRFVFSNSFFRRPDVPFILPHFAASDDNGSYKQRFVDVEVADRTDQGAPGSHRVMIPFWSTEHRSRIYEGMARLLVAHVIPVHQLSPPSAESEHRESSEDASYDTGHRSRQSMQDDSYTDLSVEPYTVSEREGSAGLDEESDGDAVHAEDAKDSFEGDIENTAEFDVESSKSEDNTGSESAEDVASAGGTRRPNGHLPHDAHFTSYSNCLIIPVLCVADEDNIISLIASALHQRHVLRINDPVIGFSLTAGSCIARLVLGWLEPDGMGRPVSLPLLLYSANS